VTVVSSIIIENPGQRQLKARSAEFAFISSVIATIDGEPLIPAVYRSYLLR
jgi:hypothetical protein